MDDKSLTRFDNIGLNGRRGKGTAILWYAVPSNNLPIVQENSAKHFLTPSEAKPDNRLTLMFTENDAQSVHISGGKGSSISLLTSIEASSSIDKTFVKFIVPQGFVVSVGAFNLQLARNPNLAKLIKNTRDVAYGIVDGKLQDYCER